MLVLLNSDCITHFFFTLQVSLLCCSLSCPFLTHVVLLSEASAKTRDGVQCAFEELVEKILQTPGLWESSMQNHGVQLSDHEQQRQGACGGYCSLV